MNYQMNRPGFELPLRSWTLTNQTSDTLAPVIYPTIKAPCAEPEDFLRRKAFGQSSSEHVVQMKIRSLLGRAIHYVTKIQDGEAIHSVGA